MKRARHYPLKTEKVLTAAELTAAGLRFLVANYYQSQEMRKRTDMQFRHLGDRVEAMDEDTLKILRYANESFADIEEQVAKALKKILDDPTAEWFALAQWMMSQRGIGHIISAGLIAHIDITKAPTVGHIWRFAGLDPTSSWNKSEKRPWNAELKTLCWHAGQCFMKQSGDPDCHYGKIYKTRKEYEVKRNESGGNAETAKEILSKKKFDKKTDAYKHLMGGKLPPAQIDARARRYAVKIFLSHLQLVWWWLKFKTLPPKSWALEHGGHAHEMMPQHLDLVPGLEEAMREAGRGFMIAAE